MDRNLKKKRRKEVTTILKRAIIRSVRSGPGRPVDEKLDEPPGLLLITPLG